MTNGIYDLIIIGAGPAGLTAAIYGGRAKLDLLLLEREFPGGQAAKTDELVNYPGFGLGSSGGQVMQQLLKHAKEFGARLKIDEVAELNLSSNIKTVMTQKDQVYQSRSVIVASGMRPNRLNIPGELEFSNRGVSYCATCDGALFSDKKVIVVGSGDSAISNALYLTRFADSVSIVVRHEEGKIFSNRLNAERALNHPQINWLWESELAEIKGEDRVERVLVKNLVNGNIYQEAAGGVFIFAGSSPQTSFLQGQVELDDKGFIITDEEMETSVPGIYAAGDIRKKYLRQVVTATNDGAVALTAAERYLSSEKFFRQEVLEEERLVAVVFWTPKIPESRMAVAALEQAAHDLATKVKLVKMDIYHNQRWARYFQVTAAPTALILRQGEQTGDLISDFSEENLRGLLEAELVTYEKKGNVLLPNP